MNAFLERCIKNATTNQPKDYLYEVSTIKIKIFKKQTHFLKHHNVLVLGNNHNETAIIFVTKKFMTTLSEEELAGYCALKLEGKLEVKVLK